MLAKQRPQALADLCLAVLRTGAAHDERDAELLRPVLRAAVAQQRDVQGSASIA
jgi:hypothetical protein